MLGLLIALVAFALTIGLADLAIGRHRRSTARGDELLAAAVEGSGESELLRSGADVARTREAARLRRVSRLVAALAATSALLWVRLLTGSPVHLGLPHVASGLTPYLPAVVLVVLLGLLMGLPMLAMGRSPHVLFRPGQVDIRLRDVKGAGVVLEEAVKSLNLFLAHKTFRERMGGTPRRAILFEGPPGTGKTYLAKAMAAEAGVPFLFVSSTAFQSHFYGATARKLRAYFKALRKAARGEGGAIGFIEEIDAINWWLPPERQLRKACPKPANILVIGATNRAADLDPALLRPGRFDRSIAFDLPSRAGRREIIDFYLDRKAHTATLDLEERRAALAAITIGYTPVMIEHLLDEALVWALRRGATQLDWADVQRAKMTEEIGLAQPVEYTEAERRTIATHEAGHAAVAWLVGKGRRLEVLSIIKRREALGLLAHSEDEERFTKTRSELTTLVQIAFGGMVAEELFFGEAGTGPAGDLEAATNTAASSDTSEPDMP